MLTGQLQAPENCTRPGGTGTGFLGLWTARGGAQPSLAPALNLYVLVKQAGRAPSPRRAPPSQPGRAPGLRRGGREPRDPRGKSGPCGLSTNWKLWEGTLGQALSRLFLPSPLPASAGLWGLRGHLPPATGAGPGVLQSPTRSFLVEIKKEDKKIPSPLPPRSGCKAQDRPYPQNTKA